MSGMFRNATNFNQPLDSWDTSSVTDMSGMFCGATNFNQPLNKWDTSRVANMSGMFSADIFNRLLHLSAENDNTLPMQFNQPLDKWDTSNVTDMSGMFYYAKNFNQPLDKWNTSSVTNMEYMFFGAKSFNQNLSAWGDKLDKVKDMSSMFKDATSLTYDFFSWWETSEVCDLKDRIKDSGVEKLRDARKKISEIGCITKEQRVELAQIDKELKKKKKETRTFKF